MTDHDPIDKGKVTGVVFDLLDHLDEWYGQADEIGHVLVVVRVMDSDGGRCTDVVTSPGTPKEEALEMLARAQAIHGRAAARREPGAAGLVAEDFGSAKSDGWRQALARNARGRHGHQQGG